MTCATCGGVMLGADELIEALSAMNSDELAAIDDLVRPAVVTQRPCPRCRALMDGASIGAVVIDRCAEHGIWFDGKELAAVLEASGEAHAPSTATVKPTPGRNLWRMISTPKA